MAGRISNDVSPPLGGSLADLRFWDKKKAEDGEKGKRLDGPGWDQEGFVEGCQITLSKSEENRTIFRNLLKLLSGQRR